MELKFMTEPPLEPKLMTCPNCGETEHIWIHSQKDRRLRYRTPAELYLVWVAGWTASSC